MIESWHRMLTQALKENGEDWSDVVSHTMTDAELHQKFDGGFGCSEGPAFTLWTKNSVYFPVVYDGAEWPGSVPRNPCDEATDHMGGQ